MSQALGLIIALPGLWMIYRPLAFIVLGCIIYSTGVLEEISDGSGTRDS